MAATYPSGIRTFPSYANGDQVTPATINDPNLEITAIETGLREGVGHHLVPDVTGNNRSLGTSAQQWYDLVLSHDLIVGGTVTVTGDITLTSGTINGPLEVTGDTHLDGGLDVGGIANFQQSLAVGGLLYAANFHNEGLSDLVGNVSMEADLLVAGNTQLDGTLTAVGAILNDGGIQTTFVDDTGDLHVAGGATLGGLTVSGSVTGYVATIVNTNSAGNGLSIKAASGNTAALRVQNALGADQAIVTAAGQLQINSLICHASATIETTLDVRTAILSNLQPGVTVGTTATTIYTAALVNACDVGGMVLVCGTLVGNAGVQFIDWVLVMTDGFTSLIAGHSKNAAAARTYSFSGLNLQLTMGAGSYHVSTLPMLVGTPGG